MVKYRKNLNVPSNFLIQIKLQEFIETKNRTVALAGDRVVRASAYPLYGHEFYLGKGHVPRLQIHSPSHSG